jgi:hypothetical protein
MKKVIILILNSELTMAFAQMLQMQGLNGSLVGAQF